MWLFVDCSGVKRVASGTVKWCLLSFGAFCDLLADFLADSADRGNNGMCDGSASGYYRISGDASNSRNCGGCDQLAKVSGSTYLINGEVQYGE